MRVNVSTALDAMFRGKDAHPSNSVFSVQNGEDGFRTTYSYGYHFPLVILTGSCALVNDDKYSVTTSCQQSSVREYLTRAGYTPTKQKHTMRNREYTVWQGDETTTYDRIPGIVKASRSR